MERAREVTRNGKYINVEYVRFADDLVVLIDAHKRHDWLIGAVTKRLREEFAKLQVEINDEKSRIVDLERGESFGFLGFDFRRIRSGRVPGVRSSRRSSRNERQCCENSRKYSAATDPNP